MKIIHRVGLRASTDQLRALSALGVDVKVAAGGPPAEHTLVTFDVAEDHPNWSSVSPLLERWQVSDVARTQFTKRELDSARWLVMEAWHHGYPQPEEDSFGYLGVTYDLSDWCPDCGVGKRQRAPFRMKGEPRWGRNSALQLIWVYDEVFVRPETWAEVFRPHRMACRCVLDSTGSKELEGVVQIVVEERVKLVHDGLASETCARCHRVKFLPVSRGKFPPLSRDPSSAMARTEEEFGSGGQADGRLLVSHEVRRSLEAAGVRGPWFTPAGEADGSTT